MRRSTPPPEYIDELPCSPTVFKREHARLHGLAYSHGATPIPCRLNVALLEGLGQTFGCRGNKEVAPSRQSSSASLAPMLHLGDGSLDGLASCFAEELRRQGERQDRMMEMLLNHHNQQRQPLMDSPEAKRGRGEEEVSTFSRAGSRRRFLLDDRFQEALGGRSALTDIGQQTHPSVRCDVAGADADAVFDEPVESAAEGSAAVQASPAAAALSLAGDESSATGEAAPPAAPPCALLDALEERDAKRKIAAKVAKAQALLQEKAQAKLAAERAAVPSASAAQPAAEPTGVGGTPSGAEALAPDSQLPKEPPVQQKGQAKRSKKAAKRSKKAAAPKASPLAPPAAAPAEAPAAEAPAAAPAEAPVVTLNIERTRTQALVRVGKAPNQRCKQFKWGEKTWHKYRTEEAATTAARAWIASGCPRE